MSTLYAATGEAIAIIEQAGATWHVRCTLTGSKAQCLARDRHGAIYAGTHGNGLWRSDDGDAWHDTHLPANDIFSVAVSPVDGAVYAGCEPSQLFRSDDAGQSWRELRALRELPSAPTWSFPPRPWTSHVRWVAPSPHDAGRLLVGIELGGLMLSDDGGETWVDHRPGAQRDVHAIAWHPQVPGRAYEAGGGGAAWSNDGGWTWAPADQGRDRHYTWALAAHPDDPDCWFVSASFSARYAHHEGDAQALIYRWRGAGPWQPLGAGLPQPAHSLPAALVYGTTTLYAGFRNGTIYASTDAGDTWQPLELTGDRLQRIEALAL